MKESIATPPFFGRLKLQVEGLQGRFNLGPCTSETMGYLGLGHGCVEPWQGAARRSVRPWSEGSKEAEPSAMLVMAWSQLVLRLGGLSGVDGLAWKVLLICLRPAGESQASTASLLTHDE